ncbi:hypothetical protein Q4E40_01405 [Pontibacter sp. BT731]|nr:hypothetical protein [Pontibacter sp. BT731]
MGKCFALLISIIALTIASCSNNKDETPAPTDILGKWTLNQVYANDHWGGPLYWQPAKSGIEIEFTSDKKFFKKYPSDGFYSLQGSFVKLNDSTLQITRLNPADPSFPTYELSYSFETGGVLILGNRHMHEGVVKEKFKIQKSDTSK